MRKAILSAAIVVATLASCEKEVSDVNSLGYSEGEKSELRVFIEYCRGNEGLQQPAYYENIWECSDAEMWRMARYYGEQDGFADVTDYPHQCQVDAILHRGKQR